MKKKTVSAAAAAVTALLLAAAFVLMPAPAAGLYIRIYFDEIQGDGCALYYAVDDGGFSQEQCVSSAVDYDRKMVEFALDPSLEGRITGLRLDFPDMEQLICVKTITVSSAGAIQREFNPCDFFGGDNAEYSNDIDAMSLVSVRARAYIRTLSGDPYLILSGGLCRRIMDCYSHFRLTRLAICVFLGGSFLLARSKIFGSREEVGDRGNPEEGEKA